MKINFDGKDITVEEAKRLDNLYQRMKKKYKSNDNGEKKDKIPTHNATFKGTKTSKK